MGYFDVNYDKSDLYEITNVSMEVSMICQCVKVTAIFKVTTS